ncbi:ABC transporter C family member 8 [Rhynchospora pubera]|uniref:ABC transporter C family member 8 n=1 Tax=Rhynchospora pubera TaxID=906938 RepID=A0AAV8EV07_9POAL|nr:ABC transporter C family member 8 [Rhynchospora pubera]
MDSQGWVSQLCEGEFNIASPCIQRSLIDILNAFFLAAYILSLLISLAKENIANQRKHNNWFFISVSLCCAATGVAYVVSALLSLFEGMEVQLELVIWFFRGVNWIFLAISLSFQRNNWTKTISIFWWISFSLLISAHNVQVLVASHKLEIFELVSWPINFLLLICSLNLSFKKYTNSQRFPLANTLREPLLVETLKNSNLYQAGIFSRLTFSWLNHLLKLGRTKPLNLDDIPPIESEDTSLQASEKFLTIWRAYIYSQDKSNANSRNLIFRALFKCYKWDLLLTGFYALSKTVSIAASPLLLFAFIDYSNLEERNTQIGILLVICLISMKLVESLSQRHWFFESRRCGMKMRSALIACIFQKQLKISSNGRKRHATGEIVNYIAVDAYRLGDFPWWFHMAWSSPLQLLLSVIILFWSLGFGAIPGLVPLIIFGVLNLPFAKILQGYQSKFMVAQDERLRATSEALNNMKIIKLQSWEERFRRIVGSLRDIEFKWLSETQLKKAYGTALYWMSPTVVSAVMFAGAAVTGSAPLNASTIFTVLATLRVMSDPVRYLPEIITILIQVKVSLDRIQVFLLEDELREDDVKRDCQKKMDWDVKVEGGEFSWSPIGGPLTLRNVSFEIRRGKKVAICGPVGAGKSSLLYALLGEIPKHYGSVEVYGSVAYVSQTAWIQSGTIRENILFGKSFDEERYEKAVKACALDKDIENFDSGDATEIGQRGLNMSGGQKQRIQLARAVYNDADVYLLDDPFSAVDAHTAATLFYDCVMGALGKKTVILVTHQVEFLAEVDIIFVMEDGQITQQGTYSELLGDGTTFEKLVNAHRSSITVLEGSNQANIVSAKQEPNDHGDHRHQHTTEQHSQGEITAATKTTKNALTRLTEDEEKEIGDLGWKPYKDYLLVSKGNSLLLFLILAQVLFAAMQSMSTYWLAIVVQLSHISSGVVVGVYAALSTSSCVFAYFRSYFAARLGLNASKAFFEGFMDSVFEAPMVFFDSTPVGRILTRASSDLSILDFDIPYSIAFVVTGSIEVAVIIMIMSTVTWQVLIIAIPVLIILIYIQRYYVASARELVRINGTTKAPVMNYASESMLGVATIRAFGATERFVRTSLGLIDQDASLFFHTIASLEWVLLRVEMLQSITIITSSLFLIFVPHGSIAPGFMGLCLSYSLTLTTAQVFLTRYYSSLEHYIISVERIKQYMNIPPEPPTVIQACRPSPSWPSQGNIELQNLMVKYRPNAPFVLKGITCTFRARDKVGVVGRTGSGKSTLISSLFRLVDPAGGKILIDNLDICSIGLKDLRTKLSIIPQEPTLFRGTVRTNLDPLGLHSDHEIWEVLEKCQLKSTISFLPTLLDSPVSDDGENWSAGQRQLFCLGRVLLRKNKILVLDEATASIDSATDAVLQKVIKREFASCTVITIAHRVPTVTDSDMVLVLSYGKLEEYDKPSRLMERKNSAFSKLVQEYWSNCMRSSAIEETII